LPDQQELHTNPLSFLKKSDISKKKKKKDSDRIHFTTSSKVLSADDEYLKF